MGKREVKIVIPEGYILDEEYSTFECIVFKKIYKKIAWKELKLISGYFVTGKSNIFSVRRGESVDDNCNIFKTRKQAVASLALAQLSQLIYAYLENMGYEDWSFDNALKDGDTVWGIGINTEGHLEPLVISRRIKPFLAFPTLDLAKRFAGEQASLIRQAQEFI